MTPPLKVYIAGPYTSPDPVENTHKAIQHGDQVAALGHIPFIPHLNLLWHIICPHPADFWYEWDNHWLRVCDVVLRIAGDSPGADREIALAEELGIPVVFSVQELEQLAREKNGV